MKPSLTTDEAERGVRPPVMTKGQWSAMFTASLAAEESARRRTDDELHLRLRMYKAALGDYRRDLEWWMDRAGHRAGKTEGLLQARHAWAQEQEQE